MIYVEKGNEGYKIDENDLGEYKVRGCTVPGNQESTVPGPDTSADDKKKSGQK